MALHVHLGIAEGATRAHRHRWSSTTSHEHFELPASVQNDSQTAHSGAQSCLFQKEQQSSNENYAGCNTATRQAQHDTRRRRIPTQLALHGEIKMRITYDYLPSSFFIPTSLEITISGARIDWFFLVSFQKKKSFNVYQGFDFIKGSTFFHETSLKFHEISTISFHMLW
jgi:hypothetical protein